MAIRLRTVDDLRVALCAAKTQPKDGDLYLDDADHYALAAKFRRDWRGQVNDVEHSVEWNCMSAQGDSDGE